MDELNNILTYLQENKTRLKAIYHLSRIGVFGSFARSEQKPGSDIDIIVEFVLPPSMIKFVQFEEYLSTVLNRKVDLVTVRSINSRMREQVLNEAIFI